ncbi:hypothetical protein GbCGDNIH7_8030 [Granulibacter bethesdensis]|nr:hypothetical protein GbCGDNIH7_8030 [Granulibacter bethesdensis]
MGGGTGRAFNPVEDGKDNGLSLSGRTGFQPRGDQIFSGRVH